MGSSQQLHKEAHDATATAAFLLFRRESLAQVSTCNSNPLCSLGSLLPPLHGAHGRDWQPIWRAEMQPGRLAAWQHSRVAALQSLPMASPCRACRRGGAACPWICAAIVQVLAALPALHAAGLPCTWPSSRDASHRLLLLDRHCMFPHARSGCSSPPGSRCSPVGLMAAAHRPALQPNEQRVPAPAHASPPDL